MNVGKNGRGSQAVHTYFNAIKPLKINFSPGFRHLLSRFQTVSEIRMHRNPDPDQLSEIQTSMDFILAQKIANAIIHCPC